MARKDALLRLYEDLIAKRDALRGKLISDLNLSHAINGGAGDVGDAAAEGSQSELYTQLAALESRELTQIDQAIELIRAGRYGLCEGCGDRIPIARLKALPFTPLCIDCQRKQESSRRESGYDVDWESAYEYEGKTSDREITLGDIQLDLSE
ncbi:MAG TPA: TraR/DksA family transcriptional regulator [Planctomycetaceae bacterium]|jgi:DnaK suppressor protein|nr:TraR/DksA family transcriptional regulator [Planctomycetaceae bacterium]